MINLSQAFKDSNYFEYPFPHWVVDNIFNNEELAVLNSEFPSARSMFDHRIERYRRLADAIKNHDQETAIKAKNELGLTSTPLSNIATSSGMNYINKVLLNKFKDGKKYSQHLALESRGHSIPGSKLYTESDSFNNIITKLEDQWVSCIPYILDACRNKKSWNLPKENIDSYLYCHGDLRAISPSKSNNHTTLGMLIWNRTFACLIYLRHPDDQSEGGDLVLYEKIHNSPEKFMSSNRRVPMKYLSIAKKIKYDSNKAIFFPNHPKAIHSISSRISSSCDRRVINLTLEAKKGCFWDKDQFLDPKLDNEAAYGKYYTIDERLL